MFDSDNPFRKGDSLVDAVRSILSGKPIEEKKMDPVDQKALKGKHSDRKDKDIDNDGDVDDSDEYLHKRRQTISKAMKESEDEMDDEDENGKKKKSNGKKDEVDTEPSMDDQKNVAEAEMSDAQMKKREEIVKSMKKKMPDFKKKYGDRAKDVMYATATKMAMKEGFELTEEDFEELDEAKFSAKEIKMAIGIASDPRYKGGNMTGAAQAIDKIKPGLSDHPQVRAVLRRQNEEVELDEARRGRPRKDGSSAQGSEGLENIQMQLRKSISLRGQKDVEFTNGKKVKVSAPVAQKALSLINSMRQAKDKQIVVNYIMKSPENLNAFVTGKVDMDDMDPGARRRKLLGIKEGYEEQSKEYHSKALASAKEIVSLIEKMGPYYGCKHLSRELEDMADRLENEIEMKDRETSVNPVAGSGSY